MFREGLRPPDPFGRRDPLDELRTQDGMSLRTLSGMGPVLVVCAPTRRMLARLAKRRREIEERGVRIVLLNAGTVPDAWRYVARVDDPGSALHEGPGAFVLENGEILRRYRGKRPDYGSLT